jgi:hypothetical protein
MWKYTRIRLEVLSNLGRERKFTSATIASKTSMGRLSRRLGGDIGFAGALRLRRLLAGRYKRRDEMVAALIADPFHG